MHYNLSISLYQIHLFTVAAEFNSFTAAAVQLNTTQSAVSKSIASLETALGFPLFVRSRSKLELTRQGAYLYQQWRTLVQSVEATLTRADTIYQEDAKTLVIGIPDSLENGHVTQYAQKFRERCPEVQLSFHVIPANQLVTRLETDELDLAVTGLYERKNLDKLGIRWKSYASVSDVVIMHRTNPLAQRESISLEDLRDEPFIMLSPSDHASYFERIYLLCSQHGFQPKILTLLPNFRSMMANLISNREGVIISNQFISDVRHPDLRCYELAGTNAGMVIAWKSRNPNRYVGRFAALFPTCEPADPL